VLAFLDVLLRRAALIVEDDNPFGGTGEVGDDEADPWIKFARMPFDLGDNPARLGPATRNLSFPPKTGSLFCSS